MKIFIGADHGGFEMKEEIKLWLGDKGWEVVDLGASSLMPEDDYVDYGVMVSKALLKDRESQGILFCRNGFGMMIAANRVKGIRCGLAFNQEAVKRGRRDDDINCLSVPADYVDLETVKRIAEVYLKTDFARDNKYTRRIEKLDNLIY